MAQYDDKLKLSAAQLALREVADSLADMASGNNISSRIVASLRLLEHDCRKVAAEITDVRSSYQNAMDHLK